MRFPGLLHVNFSWNFFATLQTAEFGHLSGKLLEAYSGVVTLEPPC